MNWGQQIENCGVYLLLAGALYAIGGPLFRSTNATGQLTWRARRWRRGLTFVLLLLFSGLEVSELRNRSYIPLFLAVLLYLGVGLLSLLLLRWWWQDWQKEKAALAALIEKTHQEGQEFVVPQMSRGKKAWNWVLIVYGGLGLAGGVYAIILHLLGKAH